MFLAPSVVRQGDAVEMVAAISQSTRVHPRSPANPADQGLVIHISFLLDEYILTIQYVML
jgi:hypothetical protein